MQTEPCRNCEVPVYLAYLGEAGRTDGPVGGRIADWDWKHVGQEDGAGCRQPEPRRGRPVNDLPGL